MKHRHYIDRIHHTSVLTQDGVLRPRAPVLHTVSCACGVRGLMSDDGHTSQIFWKESGARRTLVENGPFRPQDPREHLYRSVED